MDNDGAAAAAAAVRRRSAKGGLLRQGSTLLGNARKRMVRRSSTTSSTGRGAAMAAGGLERQGDLGLERASVGSGRDKRLSGYDWFAESEHVLVGKLQQEVFDKMGEQVVFLSKLLKPKKSARDKSETKQQVLVVCKTPATAKDDDLRVHVLNVRVWSVRMSASLRSLRAVDGAPELPYAQVFNDSKLRIRLDFAPGGTARPVVALSGSLGDKCVLAYTLLQLCEIFFDFKPAVQNLKLAELKLIATEAHYSQRCALLARHGAVPVGKGLNADRNRSGSQQTSDGDGDGSGEGGGGGGGGLVDTPLLTAEEQEELWKILQAEGLSDTSASKLAEELDRRVMELEEGTGDVLRRWENRGDMSDFVGKGGEKVDPQDLHDPIAILVDELEEVHAQLDDMDAWMANYNIELRTMRKDIHKIETENNRLQLHARNHDALRTHLAQMLSHYALSDAALHTMTDLDAVLRDEVLPQVEHGETRKAGAPSGLERITQAAEELRLARQGKSHTLGTGSSGSEENAEPFPEEAHLMAVQERLAELGDLSERFCGQIHFYLSDRIRSFADAFRATIELLPTGGGELELLPQIVRRGSMHRALAPYGAMIHALVKLERDGFERVVNVYVNDMGAAYADVLQGFFRVVHSSVVADAAGDSGAAEPFALETAPPTRLGFEAAELEAAAGFASAIVSDAHVSCASALKHSLAEIVPIVLDEHEFLSVVLWRLQDYGPESNRKPPPKPEADAVAERDAALQRIFMVKCDVAACLGDFVRSAQHSVAQLVIMLAHAEAMANQHGSRAPFLRFLLHDQEQGVLMLLRARYRAFIEKQMTWVDSLRPLTRASTVLLPMLKLPVLADHLVAVWDAAAAAEDPPLFDSASAQFAGSVAGVGLSRLLRHTTAWLERTAEAAKGDLGEVVRIENYDVLAEALEKRPCALLAAAGREARERYEAAMARHVRALLLHALPELMGFVDQVAALAEEFGLEEVPFHKPRPELAHTMQTVTEVYVQDRLKALRDAAHKQAHRNERVFAALLGRAAAGVREVFSRYTELVEGAYGDVVLPTMEQVRLLADAMGASAASSSS